MKVEIIYTATCEKCGDSKSWVFDSLVLDNSINWWEPNLSRRTPEDWLTPDDCGCESYECMGCGKRTSNKGVSVR